LGASLKLRRLREKQREKEKILQQFFSIFRQLLVGRSASARITPAGFVAETSPLDRCGKVGEGFSAKHCKTMARKYQRKSGKSESL
jgi:hypothetical protein